MKNEILKFLVHLILPTRNKLNSYLRKIAKDHKVSEILEIGSGYGHFMRDYCSKNPSVNFIGMDYKFKRSFNSGLADSTWRATSPAEGFLTHDRMKRTRKTTRESTLMPSTIPNASPSRMGTRELYASRA